MKKKTIVQNLHCIVFIYNILFIVYAQLPGVFYNKIVQNRCKMCLIEYYD